MKRHGFALPATTASTAYAIPFRTDKHSRGPERIQAEPGVQVPPLYGNALIAEKHVAVRIAYKIDRLAPC